LVVEVVVEYLGSQTLKLHGYFDRNPR